MEEREGKRMAVGLGERFRQPYGCMHSPLIISAKSSVATQYNVGSSLPGSPIHLRWSTIMAAAILIHTRTENVFILRLGLLFRYLPRHIRHQTSTMRSPSHIRSSTSWHSSLLSKFARFIPVVLTGFCFLVVV